MWNEPELAMIKNLTLLNFDTDDSGQWTLAMDVGEYVTLHRGHAVAMQRRNHKHPCRHIRLLTCLNCVPVHHARWSNRQTGWLCVGMHAVPPPHVNTDRAINIWLVRRAGCYQRLLLSVLSTTDGCASAVPACSVMLYVFLPKLPSLVFIT